ncbi:MULTISPECIES: hypothetical protein [unclassified Flavobacterium]|uniref:hypothetical protein n=1 Tax=unclassified Flavobacterium TaxID=196869 RepID=UPI00361FE050
MKKILSIFLFLFAFSLSSNAQTDNSKLEGEIRAKAKKDLQAITQVVDLSGNDELFRGLFNLLVEKHTSFSREGITESERKAVSDMVSGKLIGSFTEEQITKMRQMGVYNMIVN